MINGRVYVSDSKVQSLVEDTNNINIKAKYEQITTNIFSINQIIYKPLLDGTESIKNISGTVTASDGVLTGKSGYLSAGWSNTKDWKLTCQFYIKSDTGIIICSNTTSSRDYDQIQINTSGVSQHSQSSQYTSFAFSSSLNTWHDLTIIKNSQGYTIIIDDVTAGTIDYRIPPIICIGVDSWGSNSASIKNITVVKL